jgi:HTH-type transcriptional regulator/antitoxin HipB
VPDFDLSGVLRRIRRTSDLSQRELARRLDVSKSAVAAAEAGTRDFPAGLLARAAAQAGLRLALLDADSREIAGMADHTVRDMGWRRLPAHLDIRQSDEDWWHGEERRSRPQPWYTFDRDRPLRDAYRRRNGTPEDHPHPQADDAPHERRARRRQDALRREAKERERAFLAGELRQTGPDFECTCPAGCDPVTERNADVHVEACPCRCDLD